MENTFIKLHGNTNAYLIRVDLIKWVENVENVDTDDDEFENWANSVISVGHDTQFYASETVDEISEKLEKLNPNKICVS